MPRKPKISPNATSQAHEGTLKFHLFSSLAAVLALLVFSFTASANDLFTESRTPFLHNIQLHDAQGKVITPPAALTEDGKPQDSRAAPYSPSQTCGKCHDYDTISQGWHFNAAMGNVKPGRPGEPWIFTDPATHTQIPLSYRGWPGTFKPSQLGISDYDFITNFARHFPGGGVGDPDKIDATDPRMGRMQITGALEIDCLICHQATGRYDHDGRFTAVKGQNFRWAPSVGEGLGTFASFRSAGAMADQWKPGRTVTTNLPTIRYNRARFDADNNVTFQVARRAPANNCYYCHTTETSLGDARWHSDTDVHLRAGMLCVDCHRNGLDHMIVRGYDGESKDRSVTDPMVDLRVKMLRRDNAALTDDDAKKLARQQLQSELTQIDTLSCRGCHMSGRLGSPALIHKGMPPIHFERLSCTACHSGPMPTPDQTIVHTSLAHKLGLPAPARGKETAPIIIEPIFLRAENQLISPYKMVWPSYWAHLKDGKVIPMLPAEAAKTGAMPKQESADIQRDPYNTKPLANAQIQQILQSFPENPTNGQPVYIAAGKLFRLDKNQLVTEENPAAKPYAWALAHDVRPASQALGARGCADCHSADSQVYFANVVARGPVDSTNALSKGIWEMRGDNKKVGSFFAWTFTFRPMLKIIVFGASFIVLAVLIHYGLRGVGAITTASSKKTPP